jgi:recombination protein RecA
MPPAKRAAPADVISGLSGPKKATAANIRRFEEMFAKRTGTELTHPKKQPYRVIPTGSLELDEKLVIGGWPVGRIVELHGPEHVGKTSMAMIAAAEAQRAYPDRYVGWDDMEQTFDPAWAEALGVNLDRLWLVTPLTAEDVADHLKMFVSSGMCSLVVLDSIGGMISRAEYEKDADEATVASVARIVTRMVKQCSPMARLNDTTVMVINQVRSNIARYGPETTTPGGWALKHITTMRLKVSRGGSKPLMVKIDGEDVPVGHEVAVKVEKNKTAPYGPTANLWLLNRPTAKHGAVGIDKAPEALTFGVKLGLIESAHGGRYTVDGEKLHGEDKVIAWLREHPAKIEEIRAVALREVAGKVVTSEGGHEDVEEPEEDLSEFVEEGV